MMQRDLITLNHQLKKLNLPTEFEQSLLLLIANFSAVIPVRSQVLAVAQERLGFDFKKYYRDLILLKTVFGHQSLKNNRAKHFQATVIYFKNFGVKDCKQVLFMHIILSALKSFPNTFKPNITSIFQCLFSNSPFEESLKKALVDTQSSAKLIAKIYLKLSLWETIQSSKLIKSFVWHLFQDPTCHYRSHCKLYIWLWNLIHSNLGVDVGWYNSSQISQLQQILISNRISIVRGGYISKVLFKQAWQKTDSSVPINLTDFQYRNSTNRRSLWTIAIIYKKLSQAAFDQNLQQALLRLFSQGYLFFVQWIPRPLPQSLGKLSIFFPEESNHEPSLKAVTNQAIHLLQKNKQKKNIFFLIEKNIQFLKGPQLPQPVAKLPGFYFIPFGLNFNGYQHLSLVYSITNQSSVRYICLAPYREGKCYARFLVQNCGNTIGIQQGKPHTVCQRCGSLIGNKPNMSQGKLLPNCFKVDKMSQQFYLRKLKIPRDRDFNQLFDRGLVTFDAAMLPKTMKVRGMNEMQFHLCSFLLHLAISRSSENQFLRWLIQEYGCRQMDYKSYLDSTVLTHFQVVRDKFGQYTSEVILAAANALSQDYPGSLQFEQNQARQAYEQFYLQQLRPQLKQLQRKAQILMLSNKKFQDPRLKVPQLDLQFYDYQQAIQKVITQSHSVPQILLKFDSTLKSVQALQPILSFYSGIRSSAFYFRRPLLDQVNDPHLGKSLKALVTLVKGLHDCSGPLSSRVSEVSWLFPSEWTNGIIIKKYIQQTLKVYNSMIEELVTYLMKQHSQFRPLLPGRESAWDQAAFIPPLQLALAQGLVWKDSSVSSCWSVLDEKLVFELNLSKVSFNFKFQFVQEKIYRQLSNYPTFLLQQFLEDSQHPHIRFIKQIQKGIQNLIHPLCMQPLQRLPVLFKEFNIYFVALIKIFICTVLTNPGIQPNPNADLLLQLLHQSFQEMSYTNLNFPDIGKAEVVRREGGVPIGQAMEVLKQLSNE